MVKFHLRKHQRFNEVVSVQYGPEGTACDGALNDRSLSGASITGTGPVSVGMGLTVQLCVPGDPEPFRIERARVKWVKHRITRQEFGVEFELLPATVRARLHQLVSRLIHDHGRHRATRGANDGSPSPPLRAEERASGSHGEERRSHR